MDALIYLYSSPGRPLDWEAGFAAIDNAPIEELREQQLETFPWYPQDGSDNLVRDEVKDYFSALKEIVESDSQTTNLRIWDIGGNIVYIARDADEGDYSLTSDYGVFETTYRFPAILNAIGLSF